MILNNELNENHLIITDYLLSEEILSITGTKNQTQFRGRLSIARSQKPYVLIGQITF